MEVVGNKLASGSYLINYDGIFDMKLVDKVIDGFYLTKEIDYNTFEQLVPNIKFYAKII